MLVGGDITPPGRREERGEEKEGKRREGGRKGERFLWWTKLKEAKTERNCARRGEEIRREN